VPATMADVEEMLEGYEWASEDVMGRKASRGAADLIEARLLDELMALEKVIYCLTKEMGRLHFSDRPTFTLSLNRMIA